MRKPLLKELREYSITPTAESLPMYSYLRVNMGERGHRSTFSDPLGVSRHGVGFALKRTELTLQLRSE